MDNKEILYELSLKFNTLKMYDNTIKQMIKNSIASEKNIDKVREERNDIEKEIEWLLNPKNDCGVKTGIKNPSISENKFLKEANKSNDYDFDGAEENVYELGLDEMPYEGSYEYLPSLEEKAEQINEGIKDKKPHLADIQDKISNSKWISCSNFIFRFPKDEINIDEWRVSSFFYSLNNITQNCSCNIYDEERDNSKLGGAFYVSVNDFSEQIDNANYNILPQIILDLYKNPVIEKNIHVDIIDNNGGLLYTIVFQKCKFVGVSGSISCFDYTNTALNKTELGFIFKNIVILAPNEELECDNQ